MRAHRCVAGIASSVACIEARSLLASAGALRCVRLSREGSRPALVALRSSPLTGEESHRLGADQPMARGYTRREP